jgi:hypothetical protein
MGDAIGQNEPETQLWQLNALLEARKEEKRPVSQGMQDDSEAWPSCV